jgi:antitoxin component YwqK of YwqJK toxin-antitoxin module
MKILQKEFYRDGNILSYIGMKNGKLGVKIWGVILEM